MSVIQLIQVKMISKEITNSSGGTLLPDGQQKILNQIKSVFKEPECTPRFRQLTSKDIIVPCRVHGFISLQCKMDQHKSSGRPGAWKLKL